LRWRKRYRENAVAGSPKLHKKRNGGHNVSHATAMKEFSIWERKARLLISELLKPELICRGEIQSEPDTIWHETTIKGSALGMAKASRPGWMLR
jgi:hypothetical protein